MIELILFNKVYNVANDPNTPTLSPDQRSEEHTSELQSH